MLSAMVRKRCSSSRSAASSRLRSVMSATVPMIRLQRPSVKKAWAETSIQRSSPSLAADDLELLGLVDEAGGAIAACTVLCRRSRLRGWTPLINEVEGRLRGPVAGRRSCGSGRPTSSGRRQDRNPTARARRPRTASRALVSASRSEASTRLRSVMSTTAPGKRVRLSVRARYRLRPRAEIQRDWPSAWTTRCSITYSPFSAMRLAGRRHDPDPVVRMDARPRRRAIGRPWAACAGSTANSRAKRGSA